MPAQEDLERFQGIAEELGLDGEDADKFVNSAMKRKGYKPSMAWNDPEPEPEEDGDEDDFFTNRKKKKQEQQQQQQQQDPPKKKASGGGFGGIYDD